MANGPKRKIAEVMDAAVAATAVAVAEATAITTTTTTTSTTVLFLLNYHFNDEFADLLSRSPLS